MRGPKIRTVLSPAWTTDWMSEDGRRKLREYGIAPPQASSSRRALFGEQQVACPQCGSDEYRSAVRIRLDLLQGAVALQGAAASRSTISSVIDVRHPVIASEAKQSISPQRKMDCFVACAPRNDGEGKIMSLAPRFHRLAVNDLRREAPDAVSLTFAIPKELSGDYSFAPGQYLTLRTTMDGEEVRRSYSICSGPDDGELRIAVKKVDGGAFSSWAADDLKAGDELDVMTPTGRFGVAHAPEEARVYVGFAAGSGITPILSIVKGVLAREPNSRFFLFYGNRSTARHAVPRGAGGTEGPLPAAALGVPRHIGRRAGHPDPARPARRRESSRAAALAGSGSERSITSSSAVRPG